MLDNEGLGVPLPMYAIQLELWCAGSIFASLRDLWISTTPNYSAGINPHSPESWKHVQDLRSSLNHLESSPASSIRLYNCTPSDPCMMSLAAILPFPKTYPDPSSPSFTHLQPWASGFLLTEQWGYTQCFHAAMVEVRIETCTCCNRMVHQFNGFIQPKAVLKKVTFPIIRSRRAP